jgi:hypothetical protein
MGKPCLLAILLQDDIPGSAICHALQFGTVSAAAGVGGSTRYALAADASAHRRMEAWSLMMIDF